MGPKSGGSVSATEYIDHCGIYIDMVLLEYQLYKTIDVNFISLLNFTALLLNKLYPIFLLINIYVIIPNLFNILSKAARLLFKKIDTYTEVILWLSGFVDSSFWPTLLFKVSLQNVLPVKGVEIYINHQNFSLTSIIGLLP